MWKQLLGTVAPTIATAIGGPFGGLAATTICNALGLDGDKKTERDLKIALQNPTQEQILALRKAETNFLIRMKELEITKEELVVVDKDSARNREIKTADSWTPRILAAVAVLGFFAIVALILYMPMSEMSAQQGTLIGTCLGYAISLAKDAYSYYFGSSSGSEEKNKLIWQSTPK